MICNPRFAVVVFALTMLLPILIFADSPRGSDRQGRDEQWTIDTDFEGGSAIVLKIDPGKTFIQIMPGGDPVRGWPAWWCFRVKGCADAQRLKLSVVPSTDLIPIGHPGAGKPLSRTWAMPDRAAWSTDLEHWQQTPLGRRENGGMTYELTATGEDLWISWGPMATPTMTNRWLERTAEKHEFAETFELAKTREGRFVRGIRIASGDDPLETRPVVWLQARQHAWESGSSWVARGILEWLTNEAPEAIWLRENTIVFLVPIMDVDRAATGDGGKESTPHDHNRDWSDKPFYPEVAAVQERIKEWTVQQRMAIFLDLHNPGPRDQQAYFYVSPDEVMNELRQARQTLFLGAIHAEWTAPIALDQKTRSMGPTYHRRWQQISSTWATQHGNDTTISVCLESAWNTPHSTTQGYREIGASVAKGISKFLRLDSIPADRVK